MKRIYIIIILILFAYSIYETRLFYKMQHTCNEYRILIEKENVEKSIMGANIKSYLDIFFNDSENFNLYTDRIISKYGIENKVVFFFRQETCMKCVLQELSDIDSILLRIVPPEDIVLVCQSIDENLFANEALAKYNKRFRTIWISTDDYFKPLAHKPYLFIANKNNASNYLYIPELLPMYKEKYFSEIVPSYIH